MKRTLLLIGILSVTMALAGPPTKKAKWTALFDGKTTTGWHRYLKTDTNGWRVDNGTLTTDGKQGDLVSDKDYENFDLEFEFKVQAFDGLPLVVFVGHRTGVYQVNDGADAAQAQRQKVENPHTNLS